MISTNKNKIKKHFNKLLNFVVLTVSKMHKVIDMYRWSKTIKLFQITYRNMHGFY